MTEPNETEEKVESYVIVPAGSVVTASLVVCGYIGPEGNHGFAVRAHGDSPSTTYLGLLVKAQMEVLAWGDEHG